MTDKSDTRGLVDEFATERTLSLLVQASRVSPHLREAVATVEDAHRAALSCVRRLLDGWEPVLQPDGGWLWHHPHRHPTTAELSPSEVHTIEMVRGEG